MSREYVIGVDGGRTGSRAIAIDVTGRVIGQATAGPCWPTSTPLARAKAVAEAGQAIRRVQRAASGAHCAAVCFGMTTGGEQSAMAPSYHRLARRVLRGASVVVRHDAFTNLVGAAGTMQGVVVIAGGGSIACGYTAGGKEERSGGWGSLLGDEGSAFWIGRAAIVAASRAVDGRGGATRLARRIPAHFGVPILRDVYRKADRGEIGVPDLAGLVPLVAECAGAGDREARAVLKRAAEELAETTAAVLKKMKLRNRATPVFVTGGVFKEDRFLLPAFRRSLRARAPKAEVRHPRFPPVVGCALVALHAAGHEITAAALDEIDRTLQPAGPRASS